MSRDYLVRPGTPGQRLRDAAIHLTAPATAAALVAVPGRPALWLTVLLPLGPLLGGRVLAGRRAVGLEHRARAVDFNITVALYTLGVYGMLQLGARVEALGVLVAVGVLLLLLLLLNWLLMSAVAANRARYGELFDPPWVLPIHSALAAAARSHRSPKSGATAPEPLRSGGRANGYASLAHTGEAVARAARERSEQERERHDCNTTGLHLRARLQRRK